MTLMGYTSKSLSEEVNLILEGRVERLDEYSKSNTGEGLRGKPLEADEGF